MYICTYICNEVPLHACVTGTHTCGPSESLSLQVRWSSVPDYKMSALPLYATVALLAKVMPNNSKPSPNTSYTDSYYVHGTATSTTAMDEPDSPCWHSVLSAYTADRTEQRGAGYNTSRHTKTPCDLSVERISGTSSKQLETD